MSDRKFPLQVWIMLSIMASVLLAGYLVFPKTDSEREALLSRLGTTNKGVLLRPVVDVTGLGWRDESGSPWRLSAAEKKWRLVVPAGADCDESCRKMLYLARQVHTRLGIKSLRVEGIYLDLDKTLRPETADYLRREQSGLKILYGDSDRLAQALAATNADWRQDVTRLFVVDPNGLAMMYYTSRHSGNEILADLNLLLKYSDR